MRAVSVRVDDVIGVAGYVLPGTRVDVLATASPTDSSSDTTTKVILSNVQVLTAGTRIEQDQDNKPMQVTVVTLLVAPEQAERLALASTEGKIQLALRNPLDQGSPETPGVKTAALVGTVARLTAACGVAPPADAAKACAGDHAAAGARADADRRNHPRRQAGAGSHQVAPESSDLAGSTRVCTWNQRNQSELFNQGTNMTSAYTTEPRRLRRATNGRPATTAALVVAHHRHPRCRAAGAAARSGVRSRAAAPCRGRRPPTDAPTDVDLLVGRSTVLERRRRRSRASR